MAKQPKHDEAIEEIKALEDRRYRAMLAGDSVISDMRKCPGDVCSCTNKRHWMLRVYELHALKPAKKNADLRSFL